MKLYPSIQITTVDTWSSSMPIFDVSTRQRIFSQITSCALRTQDAGPDTKHTRSVVPAQITTHTILSPST